MEEVARLSGYERIQETSPLIPADKPPRAGRRDFRSRVRSLMTGFGFSEAINYSFASNRSADQLLLPENDPRRKTVRLLNPLTEEQSVMRTTLAAGLLETVQRNLSRQVRDLKLFEIGKVFIDSGTDELPEEIEMLGGIWTGSRRPISWHSPETPCDFFDIKGAVEGLVKGLSVPGVDFTQLDDAHCDYVRPGRSALIAAGGEPIGFVGEVRRRVLNHFDIDQPCFLFEIDVRALRRRLPTTVSATAIPRFPAVSRDITLIVDRLLESSRILACVHDMKEPLVEQVVLFDVFDGKPIPAGKKSVSFRITYRSHEQTLKDDSINQLHEGISQKLLDSFDAVLPG
jgi:phenylalanyl-tRNA synthetase beta chain